MYADDFVALEQPTHGLGPSLHARTGAAVVVVAAAVSWLLEVLHLVSYTRHVRALRAQKRAPMPASSHSSASCSKAPAHGCCNDDQ